MHNPTLHDMTFRRDAKGGRPAHGFSLLEMMMVVTVILILAAISTPFYRTAVIRTREAVLREHLFTLRNLINEFTRDIGRAPLSLDEIVGRRVSGTLFREEAFVYYSFMGRVRRVDVGGRVYHALNRANFRSRLFKKEEHYRDFLILVEESLEFVPMRILAYCLMPNHWHMVLYPRADGDLSRFLQRITLTHTQRYHAKTRTVGYGHIYQGRYKSLPVEEDGHFLTLVRYVERNAQRAGLVKRAEEWRWSSVDARLHGNDGQKGLLSPWPVPEPEEYLEWLNRSQPKEEVEKIRHAIKRSKPYGSEGWVSKAVAQFGLENTVRNPWRPSKGT